jgi:hypothetical protein
MERHDFRTGPAYEVFDRLFPTSNWRNYQIWGPYSQAKCSGPRPAMTTTLKSFSDLQVQTMTAHKLMTIRTAMYRIILTSSSTIFRRLWIPWDSRIEPCRDPRSRLLQGFSAFQSWRYIFFWTFFCWGKLVTNAGTFIFSRIELLRWPKIRVTFNLSSLVRS